MISSAYRLFLLSSILLCSPTFASVIPLKVGQFAAALAEGAIGYAVDAALESLSGEDPKTFYHLEEDNEHFVLDFHSGFNGDVSGVELTFEKNWFFLLKINASDFWGLSYSGVDNVSFSGNSYHMKDRIHGHPVKGDTVFFDYASPSGTELITDVDGLDEWFFPDKSIAGHNVSGSRIWWDDPIGSVKHNGHKDLFSAAKFELFVDTRGNGLPEDDILSWSFHLEAKHVPEPSSLVLLLLGILFVVYRRCV